jgi:hypothetical protein
MLVLGALIPALLTTTALAQDANAPSFTLTGTTGVTGFLLPDYDDGLFGDPATDPLIGGMLGLSGNATVGQHGDWDVILGFNVFGALAGANSTSTETFDGPGTVYISGLSTPGGSSAIVLDTTAGNATTTLTPPLGGANSVVDDGGGATVNAATVVPTAPGFILGAVTMEGGAGMAAGAIASSDGGIFVATGDLTGMKVTTDTSRNVFYAGADLTIGLGSADNGGTLYSVYAGPSYRGLYQGTVTDLTVDMMEADDGGAVTLPNFTISSDENLDTHYLGGLLGGTAAFAVGNGMILSLGVEGGVYGVSASWNGTDTYSSEGGLFNDPNDTPDAGSVAQTPISVTADQLSEDDITNDTIAFAARGNASVTWAIGENQAFSLGGNIEYLSQVATVTHDRVSGPLPYDETVSWPADGGPTGAPSFSWGSMVNFGITASLTGAF